MHRPRTSVHCHRVGRRERRCHLDEFPSSYDQEVHQEGPEAEAPPAEGGGMPTPPKPTDSNTPDRGSVAFGMIFGINLD